MEYSGIVLAGGRSSRMQTNKALMEFNKERMINSVLAVLGKVVNEIIIVTNDPVDYIDYDALLVADLIPGRGPLSGIHAGLKAAHGEYCFVAACDMPFLNPQLISYMLSLAPGHDAVVPRLGEYYQPLHAVYSKNCIKVIEENLLAGKSKVTSFYEAIRIKYIGPEEIAPLADTDRVFFNINDRQDLLQAKKMAGEENGQ